MPHRDDPIARRARSQGQRLRGAADGSVSTLRMPRLSSSRREAPHERRRAIFFRTSGDHRQRRAPHRLSGGMAMGTGPARRAVLHRAATFDGRREFVHAWQSSHLLLHTGVTIGRGAGRLSSRQPPRRRLRLSARHVADSGVCAFALHSGAADRAEGCVRAAVHSVDGLYGLPENPGGDPDRVLSGDGQRH